MKRTYLLDTSLINHLLCVNLNSTYLSDCLVNLADDEGVEEYGAGNFEIYYDHQANLMCIEDALRHTIDEMVMPFLKDYGIEKIELGGWHHPKFYTHPWNQDTIELNVTVETSVFFAKANEKTSKWIYDQAANLYIVRNFVTPNSRQPESLLDLVMGLFNENSWPEYAVGEYLAVLLWEKFGDKELQDYMETYYFDHSEGDGIAYPIDKRPEPINL